MECFYIKQGVQGTLKVFSPQTAEEIEGQTDFAGTVNIFAAT